MGAGNLLFSVRLTSPHAPRVRVRRSCDCARSYAIGGALVWALIVQKMLRSPSEETPAAVRSKTDTAAPPLAPGTEAKGGVAAKAA